MKKITALFLALALCLSLCTVTAFAAPQKHTITVDVENAEYGRVTYCDNDVANANLSLNEGITATIKAEANPGYTAEVYVDETRREPWNDDEETGDECLVVIQETPCTYQYMFSNIQSDHTIRFVFTPAPASNWSLLANAMAGEEQETLPGVFEVSENTPDSGTRTIKLLSNITAEEDDSVLEVPSGENIVLDLNGYTIDRGLSEETPEGYVVKVEGELTLNDNSEDHSGTITGGNNTSDGGGVFVDSGSFTMNNGTITGNKARKGGGVYVNSNESIKSEFTMNNGKITDNKASKYGGGVYVTSDYNIKSEFTMKNGTITGNKAQFAGGIQNNKSSLILTADSGKSITITGNTATDAEGGIANFGELKLSGKIIIKDNICTKKYTDKDIGVLPGEELNYPINLVTDIRYLIEIDGPLTGSDISVSLMIEKGDDHTIGTLTSGYKNSGATDINDFFHYDGPDKLYMDLNADGELEVKKVASKNRIVVTECNNGSVTADKQTASKDETVTLTVTPDAGYQLKSLTASDADGAITVSQDNKFTMREKPVTVTAEFEEVAQSEITLDMQGGTGGSGSVTATYGEAMPSATMPTKAGYTFNGYFDAASGGTKYYNADGTSAKNWDKTGAAVTLYAQWTKVHHSSGGGGVSSYTVKFDTNGGNALKNVSVRAGQTIGTIETPKKEGFVFDGWYQDKELTKPFNADDKVTKSTTLYAGWKVDPVRQITLTIGKKEATVFTKEMANDVAPKIVNDRTMLPIRFIAEALGATVDWNGEKELVTISNEGLKIEITIGKDVALVNGKEVKLDSPAFIENDRTYLPLRFVAENLGAEVEWFEATQQVVITK